MVVDASLLITQHYKVRIKGEWSNPGKETVSSPTPRCSSHWKGILWVALDYSWPTYIYVVNSFSFQTFLVQAFKIILDSWKFTLLLLYFLWNDWPIFMISASNEHLQQELEYTLLKPDCHSRWLSKMQSDTLEERYAIKLCFKLGKNATETYGMLQTAFESSCMNRTSVFDWHKRFKECRESVRDAERCGRSKELRTPEIIGQRVRLRVRVILFRS